MYHFYSLNRDEFLRHYHRRSNIETTFSMVKAKFGDAVRSKTDVAMKNEVLCKFLAHNLCCVIQSQCELGIEAKFWGDEQGEVATEQVETVQRVVVNPVVAAFVEAPAPVQGVATRMVMCGA